MAGLVTDVRHRPLPPTPIAVLLGGPSAEHDVSLVSGRAIATALAGRGHPVEGWLIDLDGAWWQLPPPAMDPAIPVTGYDDPRMLGATGPTGAAAALEQLAAREAPPVVFPALHGPFGEDGTVQALVASAGLVCCGSGPAASAVGMDKTLFKRICAAIDLPVLPWVEVRARDWSERRSAVVVELEAFASDLPDPRLIIKPARLGSSIGISIVHRPEEPPELEWAIAVALEYDDLVMAEPYLDHPRELEVAIVGDTPTDLEVFGPGEVRPNREFYDYVAKYRSADSTSDLSPSLDADLATEIRRVASAAFLAIGAGGFARVDCLLSRDGSLYLSEINTIPGFTPISLFPALCATGGYDFGGICERIVGLALERAALTPRRRLTRADLP
jgi:D-alanine-D-alanine ligase